MIYTKQLERNSPPVRNQKRTENGNKFIEVELNEMLMVPRTEKIMCHGYTTIFVDSAAASKFHRRSNAIKQLPESLEKTEADLSFL